MRRRDDTPSKLAAFAAMATLVVATGCDDKPGGAGGADLAQGLVSVDGGDRTIEHASCKVVKVSKNGTITVEGDDGLEIVVGDDGTIVSSTKDLKFRDEEGNKKVYVASSKKLVSEDVYLGDRGKAAGGADAVEDDDAPPPLTDDDDDDGSKVTICHVPPGNPANQHTITVGASAVSAHLKHGDYEGACDGRDVGGKDKGKGKPKGKGPKGKGPRAKAGGK